MIICMKVRVGGVPLKHQDFGGIVTEIDRRWSAIVYKFSRLRVIDILQSRSRGFRSSLKAFSNQTNTMATPGAWNIDRLLHKLLDDIFIETFFSESWNAERKMIDVRSADASVSEGDRISKENSSGIRYYDVFDNWSSWNRGRGFKGGNNNGGRVGRLNNGSRYSSSGAQNGAQLLWGQKNDVFHSQGSDVTQRKYILPMTNPDALKHRAISMAPSTAEKNVLQFPLPPSQFRNLYSRPPPTPTWSQNNIQVRIAFSNPCIYANTCMLKSTASWLLQ